MKRINIIILLIIFIPVAIILYLKFKPDDINEMKKASNSIYNNVLDYYNNQLAIDQVLNNSIDIKTLDLDYDIEKGTAEMNNIGLFKVVIYYKDYCMKKEFNETSFTIKKDKISNCN